MLLKDRTYETAAYMALCSEPRLDRVTEQQTNRIGYWIYSYKTHWN